jgi:integrase-like protein
VLSRSRRPSVPLHRTLSPSRPVRPRPARPRQTRSDRMPSVRCLTGMASSVDSWLRGFAVGRSGMSASHQTKSGKVRRVPIREEFCGRVGRLVPFTSHGAFSRQVAKLSGVRFHVHQLRHTFACRWLERGGSLAALQELLGHSTVVTTQGYGRLAEPHVQAEAARVGRLVPEVVPGGIERKA